MDQELLELLKRVDTPTVCNAIEVVEGKRAVIKAFLDGGDKQERYHVGEELIKAMVAKGELPAEALEMHMRDKKKPKGYE